MAIQVLTSTFSRKKIRAPKTTNNGADCKMAVTEDMGVKTMAKTKQTSKELKNRPQQHVLIKVLRHNKRRLALTCIFCIRV